MAEILNLADAPPERDTVVFKGGDKCQLRSFREFEWRELKWIMDFNERGEAFNKIPELMRRLLVNPTDEQCQRVTMDEARRIVDFFSQRAAKAEAPEPTNSDAPSPASNDSTAAASASGPRSP